MKSIGLVGADKVVEVRVEVAEEDEVAFVQLVQDFHSGRIRPATPAVDLRGRSYAEAAKNLMSKPHTSQALRERIAEDDKRDPVDALSDAEHLHALQSLRFAEGTAAGAMDTTAAGIERAGVDALQRLLKLALESDSGQVRHVVRFLLSLYNGNRFPFDLTDFRALDDGLYDDCMRVLRMDARACRQEVHCYFKDGGRIWERMAEDWGVVEVARLKSIAKEVVERSVKYYGDSLEADLKEALRYRERCEDDF